MGDLLDQLSVFLTDLAGLQAGQATETKVDDRLGLPLAELETPLEAALRGALVLRRADDGNHLVEMLEALHQALEDVGSLACLGEQIGGAPRHHHPPEVDEVLQHRLEAEHLRPAVDQRQHDGAECQLDLGVLEEVVEHCVRARARLQLDDDAGLVIAVRLVVEALDALELVVLDELGDVGEQARLVHLVGQLAHDDLFLAVGGLLEVHLGAHHDAAVAGAVDDGQVTRVDHSPGWEVGALDDLGQLFGGGLRLIDETGDPVADLAEVVRRNVGRHADRDARGPVDEQVGNQRGHHGGFEDVRIGQIRLRHIDRLLVDVLDKGHGDGRHLGFRVALGGRRIAVD